MATLRFISDNINDEKVTLLDRYWYLLHLYILYWQFQITMLKKNLKNMIKNRSLSLFQDLRCASRSNFGKTYFSLSKGVHFIFLRCLMTTRYPQVSIEPFIARFGVVEGFQKSYPRLALRFWLMLRFWEIWQYSVFFFQKSVLWSILAHTWTLSHPYCTILEFKTQFNYSDSEVSSKTWKRG